MNVKIVLPASSKAFTALKFLSILFALSISDLILANPTFNVSVSLIIASTVARLTTIVAMLYPLSRTMLVVFSKPLNIGSIIVLLAANVDSIYFICVKISYARHLIIFVISCESAGTKAVSLYWNSFIFSSILLRKSVNALVPANSTN